MSTRRREKRRRDRVRDYDHGDHRSRTSERHYREDMLLRKIEDLKEQVRYLTGLE